MTANQRLNYAIIEAPSILGLKPTGTQRLASALLGYGLAERIGARRAGCVQPPEYSAERDVETGTLNARSIVSYTHELAGVFESVIARGETPLVLGGDCSILLGPALALNRRGRYGLLFIDGHADFYQPEVNPNGEAASMELGFATGYGPSLLADIDGRRPLFRSADTVVFGMRDHDEQRHYGSQPLPEDMHVFDLPAIRARGIRAATRGALAAVSADDLLGFYVHVDADCLDDAVMPAVDYRVPGGLSHDELATVLAGAAATGKLVGLEFTIYNPDLDPHGTAGRALVDVIATALATPDAQ